jgi:hypothetical protein
LKGIALIIVISEVLLYSLLTEEKKEEGKEKKEGEAENKDEKSESVEVKVNIFHNFSIHPIISEVL